MNPALLAPRPSKLLRDPNRPQDLLLLPVVLCRQLQPVFPGAEGRQREVGCQPTLTGRLVDALAGPDGDRQRLAIAIEKRSGPGRGTAGEHLDMEPLGARELAIWRSEVSKH